MANPSVESGPSDPPRQPSGLYACDFCGREVDRVRRVALDRDYDRLGVRHAVRYACDDCSRSKEAERKPTAAG